MKLEDRHRRVGELFEKALGLELEDRLAFLEKECEVDPTIVMEVLDLLERDSDPEGPIPRLLSDRCESAPSSELIEQLVNHRPNVSRYKFVEEVGRGGMGVVLHVWDEDLQRPLAMKVIQGRVAGKVEETPSDLPWVEPRKLNRFLEEAQITGQLDHPGIVPVHELGVDKDGRVFFTMRLVQGREFRKVIKLAHAGEQGWNLTRALEVLLKVCDAVAYAHSRGVLHRDLKPSNIMIGRFGETYVMDWGLSRFWQDGASESSAEPGPADGPGDNQGTRLLRRGSSGAGVLTREGDALGTPEYMSPEQARGALDLMGPHSDVYSIGAMLYETLTGVMAFHARGEGKLAPQDVMRRVLDGPPERVESLAPDAPPPLVAICERAMAREIAGRYATVAELSQDLRAYLDDRVVRAYRTGALIELRLWIRRHREAAASLAGILVVLLTAAFALAAQERGRRSIVERDRDERTAEALVNEADRLWPIHPEKASAMEGWLALASSLVAKLPALQAELQAFEEEHATSKREPDTLAEGDRPDPFVLVNLRNRLAGYERLIREKTAEVQDIRSEPSPNLELASSLSREIEILSGEIPILKEEVRRLDEASRRHRGWRYADADLDRRNEELSSYVRNVEFLSNGEVSEIEERLAKARDLARASIGDPAWTGAIASIADVKDCPRYKGLYIQPQLGLVPIGRNAQGLWEFWHVLSGERPERDEQGEWTVRSETGVVLILLPEGRFHMGASSDPLEHNYVEVAEEDGIEEIRPSEQPVHEVALEPFFLSKYEMTQGQWLRATGESPSLHYAGASFSGDPRISRTHPVEHVSWSDCQQALLHWSLAIPTEAQWEYAARAGETGPYWSGGSFETLLRSVNFADIAIERRGFRRVDPIQVDDGYSMHAPVDAFSANPNGLHGISGNVWEWCRDWTKRDKYEINSIDPRSGEHVPTLSITKPIRGGSFRSYPSDLRLSRRYMRVPSAREEDIGIRPSRSIDS